MGYPYQPPWETDAQVPPYKLDYGGYSPPAAPSIAADAQTAAAPSALIPGLGLGLAAVGTGLNAYGAYKASEQADKQYDLQMQEFNFQKALALQEKKRQEEEERRKAGLEGGNYAEGYLDKAIGRYGNYNAMTGR